MERNAQLMTVGALILGAIALILAGYTFGQERSLSNRVATLEDQIAAVEQVQTDQEEAFGNEVTREDFDQLAEQVALLADEVEQLTAQINGTEEPDVPEADAEEEAEAADGETPDEDAAEPDQAEEPDEEAETE